MDGDVLVNAMVGGADSLSGGVNWALVLILVLVVVVLVYVLWRATYRRAPNCAKYGAQTAQACTMMQTACDGDPACLNAVAYCTPVVDAGLAADAAGIRDPATAISTIDTSQLLACGRAIRQIAPERMVKMLSAGRGTGCLPPQYAGLSDAGSDTHKAAVKLAAVAAPMLPYLLRVASGMPACPARPKEMEFNGGGLPPGLSRLPSGQLIRTPAQLPPGVTRLPNGELVGMPV